MTRYYFLANLASRGLTLVYVRDEIFLCDIEGIRGYIAFGKQTVDWTEKNRRYCYTT